MELGDYVEVVSTALFQCVSLFSDYKEGSDVTEQPQHIYIFPMLKKHNNPWIDHDDVNLFLLGCCFSFASF